MVLILLALWLPFAGDETRSEIEQRAQTMLRRLLPVVGAHPADLPKE